MCDAVLKVQDLHFSYGSKKILNGTNLELNSGEVFCLLGPNGCGKTTLLDCILKQHVPSSGSIVLNQKKLEDMKPSILARQIAYVPQHHSSHFPFTVFDFVLMGRTPYLGLFGSPGARDREIVGHILAELDLESLKDQDYSILSGGETRMVLIARALVQEAPILVMDEPGSHLDYRNEYLLLETIISIVKDQKRSVLMTTHSPNQVYFLESCGIPVRTAILHEGGILKAGSAGDTLNPDILREIYGVKTALVTHNDMDESYSNIIPIPSRIEVRK